MNRRLLLVLLILLSFTIFPLKVLAETILEKIERTGELKAGVRVDAIPFAYKTDQGEWTGYSLELIRLIQLRLQEQLKKPLKLTLEPVTVDNRFDLVQQGKVDVVCEATTITQERLKLVDFSIPYFMTGAQFLVTLKDEPTFNVKGTLAKVSIAYIPNTTTDQIIRQIYPFANWIAVKNREEGVKKLKAGEVKAVVSDGILLVGEIVKQGKDPKDFALIPTIPMTTELYGCMLPKNNYSWKEVIDQTIASEADTQLQQKWFNIEKGSFPYIIITNP